MLIIPKWMNYHEVIFSSMLPRLYLIGVNNNTSRFKIIIFFAKKTLPIDHRQARVFFLHKIKRSHLNTYLGAWNCMRAMARMRGI